MSESDDAVARLNAKLDRAIAQFNEAVRRFDGHVIKCDVSNERKEAAFTVVAKTVAGLDTTVSELKTTVENTGTKLDKIEKLPGRIGKWAFFSVVVPIFIGIAAQFILHEDTAAKMQAAATATSKIPQKTVERLDADRITQ